MKIFCRNNLILPGIFFVALLLRIPWREVLLSRDSITYLQIAQLWNENGVIPHISRVPPLVPFFYKILLQLFETEQACLWLNIVIGAVIPVMGYLIFKKFSSDHFIAIAGALMLAFSPSLIELSMQIQRDTITLFLCCWVIWFIAEDIFNPNKIFPVGIGVTAAVAFLCRYEALELLLLYFVIKIWLFAFHKFSWKKLFYSLLVCVIFFGITVLIIISSLNCWNYVKYSIRLYIGGEIC